MSAKNQNNMMATKFDKNKRISCAYLFQFGDRFFTLWYPIYKTGCSRTINVFSRFTHKITDGNYARHVDIFFVKNLDNLENRQTKENILEMRPNFCSPSRFFFVFDESLRM